MVGAGFIFFFLVALVLFLFIWPFSRGFMTLLVAWGLGLIITIAIKMVIVKNCRKRFYAGFYRTNPNAANLATLALECWFIGKIFSFVNDVFTLKLFTHSTLL